MKLHIVQTFRSGILIYENNLLIYRTDQNNYVGFENADLFSPEQFSSKTAQAMCVKAKEIVSKTDFCCMSSFLNSLPFPIPKRQEDVAVDVVL